MGHDERRNATPQTSQFHLYDRYGKQIGVGDTIHLLGRFDIMWSVTELRPVVDPRLPSGLLMATYQAMIQAPIPGGQRIGDVLKVQDVSERAKTETLVTMPEGGLQ